MEELSPSASPEPLDALLIREQLRKILNSATLHEAPPRRRLLQYVVETALNLMQDGLAPEVIAAALNGEAIASALDSPREKDEWTYGRVRLEAGRLRGSLNEYYKHTADAIIIDLPKGRYVPIFRPRPSVGTGVGPTTVSTSARMVPTPLDLPKLRNVEYSALYPINLIAEPERVVFRLKGNLNISRLSACLTGPGKSETDGIVNGIVQQYGDKTYEEYWQLLEDLDFPFAADDDLPQGNPSQMATLKRILAKPAAFEKVRRNNVKNYLLTHTVGVAPKDYNPFDWNGHNLALVGFQQEWRDKRPKYSIAVRKSDYLTYRTMADYSEVIRQKYGLTKMLARGILHYLNHECQELIHGGVGVAVVVRTSDNKLVIRKRSDEVAKFKDENRWFMSANEGLVARDDINAPQANKGARGAASMKPCVDIVKRALRVELVGKHIDLDEKLSTCWFTGVLLYLPNLSVNPCFLVHLNATSEEVTAALDAKKISDAKSGSQTDDREFKPFKEKKGKKSKNIEYVEFTRQALGEFMRTRAKPRSWDEGSLVAVLLAAAMAES